MWLRENTWYKWCFIAVFTLVVGGCKAGFGRSGDNDLQSLSITPGNLTPSFSRDQLEYTALVGGSADTIEIIAVIESETATMTINGQSTISGSAVDVALQPGRNEIDIEVTAENEISKTYTIVVTKSNVTSSDASLATLHLKDVPLGASFVSDQLEYQSQVNFFVNQTSVSVNRGSRFATVRVEGQTTSLGDNDLSDPIDLPVEMTKDINVSVVAEDDETSNVYSVQIERGARDALQQSTFIKAVTADVGDRFAEALAVNGNTLVVGAPAEDSAFSNSDTDNSAIDAGAAYIFENTAGWSQSGYLKAFDNVLAGDRFGSSVAVADDWVAVGAPGRDGDSGRVFLYRRSSDEWQASLEVFPQDLSAGDKFGESLAMVYWPKAQTHFLFVGAPGRSSNQGAVYVYRRDQNNEWVFVTTQVASDAASGDAFGSAISVNLRSERLEYAVGAPGKNNETGVAYVFQRLEESLNSAWSQIARTEAFNPSSEDRFGTAVALAGNILSVGAPFEDSSSNALVTNINNGEVAPDNANLSNSGAVYVYRRENNNGQFFGQAFLKGNGGLESEFGSSLAITAASLAVGAPKDDSGAIGIDNDGGFSPVTDTGAVHVFTLTGATWELNPVYVKAPNLGISDEYGKGLGFIDGALFIATPGEDSRGGGVDTGFNEDSPNSGAVFIVR